MCISEVVHVAFLILSNPEINAGVGYVQRG